MDAKRFDRLARALGASGSRRGALAALLAGLVTPLLPAPEVEADRRGGKSNGTGKGKGKGSGPNDRKRRGRTKDRNRGDDTARPGPDAADTRDAPLADDTVAAESLTSPEAASDSATAESSSAQGGGKRRRGKDKDRARGKERGRNLPAATMSAPAGSRLA